MVGDGCFEDVFDLSSSASVSLPKYKEQKLNLEYNCDGPPTIEYVGKPPPLPFAASEVIHSTICDSKCLVEEQDGFKAVYEITLDIQNADLNFSPGDTIGVIPQNKLEEVNFVINTLNLTDVDKPITITSEKDVKTKIPPHIPVKSTLRHILTFCVDLRCIVKKLFLLALSQYTSDEREKKALQYLCSTEGSAFYTQVVLNKKLTFMDILKKFSLCRPPIGAILPHLPRLLPRPYSIMNTRKEDNIKICFSVDNEKGLVTGWLESLISKNSLENSMKTMSINNNVDKIVPIYLRKNTEFLIPVNAEKLILVGPGTGVAPYIGLLQEKSQEKTVKSEIWLYYGCRNPKVDFLYKNELEKYKNNGVLTKLRTAFSRIENGGIKYVQDAIYEDSDEIMKFIREGAIVCVCGDYAKMAAEVKETIVKCFVLHEKLTLEAARDVVTKMEREKKYLVDIWS